jgi:alkylation response protein AidB-like acyl-CoA dehydrogenase
MQRTLFDSEHDAFRAVIRDFIAKEVTPCYAEWEAARTTPRELFRKLGALGVTRAS